ncbi:peptide methionine sulfoxide reductase [Gramella sp. BOM4]|nr:peptide methionine sulfoxide reductase [Christiangramia bathymodioli]
MENLQKIGMGGGCHWCTEAVFQVLKGVKRVEQGYLSIDSDPEKFYEGVIVYFNSTEIDLKTLIKVHLQTHQSQENHSLRTRYLSAIYYFDKTQKARIENILDRLKEKGIKFITRAVPFGKFRASREEIRNYYRTDPERPFCKTYINPKLKIIQDHFSKHTE